MRTASSRTVLFGKEFVIAERWLRVIYLTVGALSIGAVFWWLQFSLPSICCGDFDGYYHIKWSQLLWQGLRSRHFPPAFTWLPLTTLNPSQYADQHFFFHLLLIPFTWFSDLRLGAKVATALFSAAAVFSLYWLVLRYRIRYPLLWLLALIACSSFFYSRLTMTKAQGVSILFIVVGIYLLFERKYVWLGPTAFLYVWTYNLFVMLGVLVLIWAVVVWWSERRIEWRPLLWTGLGMVAGFIVNPYFPHNVSLFLEHLIAKSGSASMPAGVGFEWYPLPTWEFLNTAVVACLSMCVGYVAFGYVLSRSQRDKIRVQRPLLFLIFSSFLLLITLRSIRFIEYWPPFAVLFAAFTLQAAWDSKPNRLPAQTENLQPVPLELEPAEEPKPEAAGALRRALFISLIVILLGADSFYNLYAARMRITDVTRAPNYYQAGTQWLLANVPPGSLIFDVNWGDFPKLFFYDTTHSYVGGLDAIYLRDKHPEFARLDDRLSNGQEQDPAAAIRSLFAAVNPGALTYLFVGNSPAPPRPEWFRYMMRLGKVKQVYADKECAILQVLDNPVPNDSESEAPSTAVSAEQPVSPGQRGRWNTPEQRKLAAAQVHRRFGDDIYGTVEDVGGVPTLVIHNKNATADWAKNLFDKDLASPAGEALWQFGFGKYAVTNGTRGWIAKVEGNEQYRGLFKDNPEPKK
ncbi:MAG TPA: hypothetical protein VK829_10345 [Terriglobales bacterium]|nr:hypothetical protein [Terriglobales bacterium]